MSKALVRYSLAAVSLALLAACSGETPEARIPVSGASGPNGGAASTIYYDGTGHAHFQS